MDELNALSGMLDLIDGERIAQPYNKLKSSSSTLDHLRP